ncbi:hypothetical protein OS493_035662 [Desmophyllum pertusum]|uniref:Uncharacterized protein n=1 Tax=Desmophyllum pertusum TaxID=174260 RepID=A0A9X0CUR0_9CNID|nr:hypothetical protein OS493_035662 [Desmophyllum pertusum]
MSDNESASAQETSQEDQGLEITVHQPNMSVSVFTSRPPSALLPVCGYLKAYLQPYVTCPYCPKPHSSPQICFTEDNMTTLEQETLRDILDSNLFFDWTIDGFQHMITNFVFLFYHSLRHEYIWRYKDYSYLQLIFVMQEAEFVVLTSGLLNYFNKFLKSLFIPQSVLFRANSLDDFLAKAQATETSVARKQRFQAAAIWHCP